MHSHGKHDLLKGAAYTEYRQISEHYVDSVPFLSLGINMLLPPLREHAALK